jgi:AcrR family transcriptional regulator
MRRQKGNRSSLVKARDSLRDQLADILALDEQPPPSMREVARRLGRPPMSLKYQFPDLTSAIVARYQAAQEAHVEALREQLLSLLAREGVPPPSAIEVARLLRYSRAYLNRQFPELMQAISARYRANVEEERTLRLEEACSTMRGVMQTLHKRSIFPSENRIKRAIGMRTFYQPKLTDTYDATLRALGYQNNRPS